MAMPQSGPAKSPILGFLGWGTWVFLILVGFALFFMFSAAPFFTVEQGEAGVVLRFGRVV